MGVNSSLARVFGSESDAIWLAPIGTPLPTDANSALDAAFQEVGWLNTDTGITEALLGSKTELRGHQGGNIVRVRWTEGGKTFAFVALEDKPLTRQLFDNVKTVTTTGSGARQETVGASAKTTSMVAVIDMFDADDVTIKERIIIPVLQIIPDGDRKYTYNEIGSARGFIGTVIGDFYRVTTQPAAKTSWTVTITGTPTGGTFSILLNGYPTSGIAYNATNTTVAAALNALSGVTGMSGITVSGSAGGPYTVTLPSAGTLAASGAGLTGGTSPAATAA